MNEITIGIPRALLYYKYHVLWENFFQELGINLIISPKTNKEIIEKGSSYVVDEACLSLKIFMGHVAYLQDKCDYLFIPRFACLKEKEKLCTNFLALYDLVHNSFPHLKLLNFNVDKEKKEEQIDGLLEIATSLGFSYLHALRAIEKAKDKEEEYYQKKETNLKNKLLSQNLKIMVVAHPYNLYDEFIGKPIINYLEKENIKVITSDIKQKKIYTKGISDTLYWTYNKELISFINTYKDQVDGIILISTFPCGPDSLANELIIRKVKNIPISYIVVDNNSSDTGLITRLESFIDIIKLKGGKLNA